MIIRSALQAVVEALSKQENRIPNIFDLPWTPFFEVSPILAQGAAREVYKKLLEMLWGVVHTALVARPWEQTVPGHLD